MTSHIGENGQNVSSQSSHLHSDTVVQNSTQINILDLPPELIFKILAHVSTKDLLRNVALASTAFYHYTKNPGIYRCVSLSLPRSTCDLQSASLFLQNLLLLEELYIKPDYSSKILNPIGHQNEKYMPENLEKMFTGILEHDHLKVLDICQFSYVVSTTCLAALGRAKWWPYLTKISLNLGPNKNPLARAGIRLAFKLLENSDNLKCLNVKMQSNSYLPIALSCKNLNILKINPKITEEQFISVLTKRSVTLKDLRIYVDLSPKAFLLIPDCHKLTALCILSRGFESFEILAQLQNLTRLELVISGVTKNYTLPPGCLSNLKSLHLTIETEQATSNWTDSNCNQSFTLACPNLKHLNVFCFSFEDNETFNLGQLFLLFIENCSQLETVVMNSGTINLEPKLMIEKLQNNQHSLKFLYLDSIQGGIEPSVFRPLFQNSVNLLAVFYNRSVCLQSSVPLSEITKMLSTVAIKHKLNLPYDRLFVY